MNVVAEAFGRVRHTTLVGVVLSLAACDGGFLEHATLPRPPTGTFCGDGLVDAGEACDDANIANDDGCSAACTVEAGWRCTGAPSLCAPVCGDNLTVGVEGCDDGDTIDNGPEECLGDCSGIQHCGDAASEGTELCDDGDNAETGEGTCLATCDGSQTCGNNDREGTEACDDGDALNNGEGSCIADCSAVQHCLDGVPDGTEVCDDGDEAETGEGTCLTTCDGYQTCGNDEQEGTEACDDGDNNGSGEGYCVSDCSAVQHCLDGVGNGTETCDDGEEAETGEGTCLKSCAGYQTCGNGTREGTEACDDSDTTSNGDGHCVADCSAVQYCGNGATEGSEPCDDGNRVDGDYCAPDCDSVIGSCGDGDLQTNEVCDDGLDNGTDGHCAGDCGGVRLCGDGAVQNGEECDDTNTTVGDGCSDTCAVETGFTCRGVPSSCVFLVYVDIDATGANDGTSWADAFASLQDALAFATGRAGNEELWVAEGTYRPDVGEAQTLGDLTASFALPAGAALYGGFVGSEVQRDPRSPREHVTRLSGDLGGGASSYHVVRTNGPVLAFDGFWVEGGDATADADKRGGGILAAPGLNVSNCVFTDNQANQGGAIWTSTDFRIVSTTFYDNTAFVDGGAAMFGLAGTIFHSRFILNHSAKGALLMPYGTIAQTLFAQNDTALVVAGGEGEGGELILESCTFVGNSTGTLHDPDIHGIAIQNSLFHDTPPITGPAGWEEPFISVYRPCTNSTEFDTPILDVTNQRNYSSALLVTPRADGFPVGPEDNDWAPAASSACLDAAEASWAPQDVADLDSDGNTAERAPFDLAGRRRFVDDQTANTGAGAPPYLDIGAFERQQGFCGNGMIDSGEACDDANSENGDHCSNNCLVASSCGDEVIQVGEECDDGFQTATCFADCAASSCSDGRINPVAGESCDDGDLEASDGCSEECRIEPGASCQGEPSICALRLYVDLEATGSEDGGSWSNAFTSLQDALASLRASGVSGEIWVAEGSYRPDVGAGLTPDDPTASFELFGGVTLFGGFAGGETAVAQRDLQEHPAMAILTGTLDSESSEHVVTASNFETLAVIDGFTIAGGDAPTSQGGGLQVSYANVTVRNVLFTKNQAVDGGALAASGMSVVTAINSRFQGNVATEQGGAVYVYGAAFRLYGCTVVGNTAGVAGGGIYTQGEQLIVLHSTITANPKFGIECAGPCEIYNSIVWGNPDGDLTGEVWPQFSDIGGYVGEESIDQDPQFLRPPSAGGDGWGNANDDYGDLRVMGTSPCVDAGNPYLIELAPELVTDLAGSPRAIDHPAENRFIGWDTPPPDMGAYETLSYCGDGVPDPSRSEVCDDGNDQVGDYCEPTCSQIIGWCGDGTTQAGLEVCDDEGETADCDTDCTEPACPDGIVNETAGEECDDNNANPADGCDACQLETAAVCSGEPSACHFRWYVDADATGANDGGSWTNAFTSLRDALDTAKAEPLGGEIWVAAGTYRPDIGGTATLNDVNAFFEVPPGVSVYGGFATGEALLGERDLTAHETILSGALDTLHSNRVVWLTGQESKTLDGLTIEGGAGTEGSAAYVEGTARIARVTFRGNHASARGPVFVRSYDYVFFMSCRFLGNSAALYGGAMFIEGAYVRIVGSLFSGNGCVGECEGHAILAIDASVSISSTTIVSAGRSVFGTGDEGAHFWVENSIVWSDGGSGLGYDPGSHANSASSLVKGWSGMGLLYGDPMFADPDGPDNTPGTSDDELWLTAGSACIDAGDNEVIPGDWADLDYDGNTSEPLPLDLAGSARRKDAAAEDTGIGEPPLVDCGAYEL